MSKFFFHTGDCGAGLDAEGQELADTNTAQIEAVRLLGELLRDEPRGFWNERAMKVVVTDEAGLILFVLDLSATEAPALSQRA